MRKFKKFAAMVSALTLAACAVAPLAMNTYAAEPNAIKSFDLVKPDDVATIDSVKAYKIFSINTESDGSYTTPDTDWQCSTDISDAIKSALSLSSPNDKPADAMAVLAGYTTDNDDSKALASAVANAIKSTTTGAITASWADNKCTFEVAPEDGYYIFLVTSTKANGDGEEDDETVYSLGMLTVIDGKPENVGTGTAKIGLPTVDKKVWEDDKSASGTAAYETDPKWNDVADLEIGQEAKFRLYGTLPSNYDYYTTYKYKFIDTLGAEFADVTTDDITVMYYADKSDMKVAPVTLDVTPSITKAANGVQTITIAWDDLKTVTGIKAESIIVVEYKTKLTKDAIIASDGGQENTVKLEYSNNPNVEGGGTTNTTPEEKVIVYTYDLEIDKTFFAGTDLTAQEIKGRAYSDFVFTLNKDGQLVKVRPTDATTDGDDVAGAYDYIIDSTAESTNMTLKVYDDNGRVDKTVVDTVSNDSTEVAYTDDMYLAIKIKGVDSDVYKVAENQSARNGNTNVQKYNDLTADADATVKVIKKGTTELETDGEIYIQDYNGTNDKLTYTVGGTAGNDVDIQNMSGKKLPGTGGIGTTIFYLGGGAMVAVAGVFLITKKRMGKREG